MMEKQNYVIISESSKVLTTSKRQNIIVSSNISGLGTDNLQRKAKCFILSLCDLDFTFTVWFTVHATHSDFLESDCRLLEEKTVRNICYVITFVMNWKLPIHYIMKQWRNNSCIDNWNYPLSIWNSKLATFGAKEHFRFQIESDYVT